MNRLTKLFLRLLVVTSVLALTYPATANLNTVDKEKNGLGLQISMDGRETFTLSLSAEKRRQAILPVKGANTTAVKVISWVENGSLKFDLLAVMDKLPATPTCENIKDLKTEQVASYVGVKGDKLRISDFEKYGVAPFTVSVVNATVCPDGWCCCLKIKCLPNPDFCIECGSCGLCCG